MDEGGAAVEEIVAGLVNVGIDADVFEIRRAGKAGGGDVVVADAERQRDARGARNFMGAS